MILWSIYASVGLLFVTGSSRTFIPAVLGFTLPFLYLLDAKISQISRKSFEKAVLVILISSVIVFGFLFPPEYENMDLKLLQTRVIEKRGNVPTNCTIITEEPSILTNVGGEKIRTPYALENPEEILNLSAENCVLFYEGIGCKGRIERFGWSSNCREMKGEFNLTEFESFHRGDLNFTFYRIKNRSENF